MPDQYRPDQGHAPVVPATSGEPTLYRSCVGIALTDGNGHLLVARRRDTPGAWQMPQGGIEKGETPRQAALREMKEELGTDAAVTVAEMPNWVTYDLPPELLGKVWKGRYRGQRQKWILLRYTGSDADIDLEAGTPEFDAWRWSTPEQVLKDIVPFKRDVYAEVLAFLAPLLKH